MRHRKLISIGTPISLTNLRALLALVESARPDDCVVRHAQGQLIIEEPRDEQLESE